MLLRSDIEKSPDINIYFADAIIVKLMVDLRISLLQIVDAITIHSIQTSPLPQITILRTPELHPFIETPDLEKPISKLRFQSHPRTRCL